MAPEPRKMRVAVRPYPILVGMRERTRFDAAFFAALPDLELISQVASLGQAFGMQVMAWGPTLTAERAARSNARFMKLDALLEEADIVTVQLKLSDQSRGLLLQHRKRSRA